MLIAAAAVLCLLWLLGFITSYTMGGLLTVLLVVTVTIAALRVISRRHSSWYSRWKRLCLRLDKVSKKILVVDDYRDAADSLALLLRIKGHDSLVAYDAQTGFVIAQQAGLDIIFHDLDMQGINGYTAAVRYRKDAAFLKTLLVAVTVHDVPSERVRAKQAGYDEYMSKPFNSAALDQILNSQRG
jgi:CheY-like chemotaxis protein